MSRLVVVHDVLGTLFSLSAPIEELQTIFADQLKRENAPPILPELIIMDWYHAAQRDFTNLSINGAYQPIGVVFKSILPRVLLQAGLVPPHQYRNDGPASLAQAGSNISLPGNNDPFDPSVVEKIMSSLQKLQPRPGMVNAFTKIYRNKDLVPDRITKVDVWGATNGGLALGEKIFKGALGDDITIYTGKDTSAEADRGDGLGKGFKLFSCDEIEIAKPDPKVYKEIRSRIGDDANTSLWFVASHTWDLFAARKAGFKTAWVGYEEFYTCSEIYGKPDIIAVDLEDAARQILLSEGPSK